MRLWSVIVDQDRVWISEVHLRNWCSHFPWLLVYMYNCISYFSMLVRQIPVNTESLAVLYYYRLLYMSFCVMIYTKKCFHHSHTGIVCLMPTALSPRGCGGIINYVTHLFYFRPHSSQWAFHNFKNCWFNCQGTILRKWRWVYLVWIHLFVRLTWLLVMCVNSASSVEYPSCNAVCCGQLISITALEFCTCYPIGVCGGLAFSFILSFNSHVLNYVVTCVDDSNSACWAAWVAQW